MYPQKCFQSEKLIYHIFSKKYYYDTKCNYQWRRNNILLSRHIFKYPLVFCFQVFFLCFGVSSLPYWRRQWHPTPVLLPGESHGQRSLVGSRTWGHRRVGRDCACTHVGSENEPCSQASKWTAASVLQPKGIPSYQQRYKFERGLQAAEKNTNWPMPSSHPFKVNRIQLHMPSLLTYKVFS